MCAHRHMLGQVESITGKFPDEDGSPLHWRQDERLSGRNIMSMGIFYEPLQRCLQSVRA